MRLTTDFLISALSVLLLLAGALWLPLVGASTGNMGMFLTVTGEDDDRGGSGGGGGGGGNSNQPSTPITPIVPLPEKPKPLAEFRLTDYVPKMIPAYRDTPIVLYGYNFPPNFKIIMKSGDTLLIADSAMLKMATVAAEGAPLEAARYVISAKTLFPGEATLQVQGPTNQMLTKPLPIFLYASAGAVNLRAQIIQKTISVTVASGKSANITIKFKNAGMTQWDYLLQPLHIGTDRPRDRQSRFAHKDWPYNNRVARISLPTNLTTGETFDATFPIQAPVVKRTTRYTENFALVAEGIAWIHGSNFTVRITVSAPVAEKIVKATTQKTTPVPAVKKPAAPYKIPNTIPVTAVKSDGWLSGIKSFLTQTLGLVGTLASNLLPK